MVFPVVKEKALEHNITVYQPQKVKTPEFVEVLKEYQPDIMVVVAFGQILSEEILNIPKYGCINVHGSILPQYRGAAPIQLSLIHILQLSELREILIRPMYKWYLFL